MLFFPAYYVCACVTDIFIDEGDETWRYMRVNEGKRMLMDVDESK